MGCDHHSARMHGWLRRARGEQPGCLAMTARDESLSIRSTVRAGSAGPFAELSLAVTPIPRPEKDEILVVCFACVFPSPRTSHTSIRYHLRIYRTAARSCCRACCRGGLDC